MSDPFAEENPWSVWSRTVNRRLAKLEDYVLKGDNSPLFKAIGECMAETHHMAEVRLSRLERQMETLDEPVKPRVRMQAGTGRSW